MICIFLSFYSSLSLFFFKLNIRTTLKGTDPVLKQHSFKHLASSLYTAAKRHADYPEGSWVRPPQCPVIARERQSYLGLPELWDFGKRHFWYQEEVSFFLFCSLDDGYVENFCFTDPADAGREASNIRVYKALGFSSSNFHHVQSQPYGKTAFWESLPLLKEQSEFKNRKRSSFSLCEPKIIV